MYDKMDYDASIECLKKAIALKPDNPTLYFVLGSDFCRKGEAINFEDLKGEARKQALEQRSAFYKKAIEAFDKCKELDPNKEQVKWGYNRQNAYYNYYGPESPEYKAAAADQ
jgi:tetratricopeptide (TPR) repeat protein